MKKLFFSFTFIGLLLFSCSKEDNSENEDLLSFNEIETLFNMKAPFSVISKQAILKKYESTNAYYNYSIKRFEEIFSSNHLKSSESNKSMADYRVTLFSYPNNLLEDITCGDDNFILSTAENNGIDLPFSDRAGASSTCAAFLHSGEIDQSEQSFLTNNQVESGWVLLCVAYPQSDCTLETHKEDDLY